MPVLAFTIVVTQPSPFFPVPSSELSSFSTPPSPGLGPFPLSLITMDSYVPIFADPPIPAAFGDLPISIAESIQVEHPISIPFPLQLSDFPDTPPGAVTFTALQRMQEFLSHGFLTDTNDPAPPRDVWLATVSQLLVFIHNSIRRTHAADPVPNAFLHLSSEEQVSLDLLLKTFSSLSDFFTDRRDNGDGVTENWKICLRCLESSHYPTDKATFDSIMMSCGQNVAGAHRTIINQAIRTLTIEMDEWVDNHRSSIKEQLIQAVVSDDGSFFRDVQDPRLLAWFETTRTNLRTLAQQNIKNEVLDETLVPWAIESLQAAKAEASRANDADLVNFIRDERAASERSATSDARSFYDDTLRNLQSEALTRATDEARAFYEAELDKLNESAKADLAVFKNEHRETLEREISAFKHSLKAEEEQRKANIRAAVTKPVTSSSLSKSASKANRGRNRVDPTARPVPRSRSQSRVRSAAPSPESQMTPRASPIVGLSHGLALTEPFLGLQAPLTDVSVGPPENSQEALMLDVQSSQMSAYSFPIPSNFERQGPPLTEDPAAVPAQPVSSTRSSTDLPTSAVERMLLEMSKSLSQISDNMSSLTSRVGRLEKPTFAYSPSHPAELWNPPRSRHPMPGDPDSDRIREPYALCPSLHEFPLDEPLFPTDYEDMDAEKEASHSALYVDRYLEELYRDRYLIPDLTDLLPAQQTSVSALPGIFSLFRRDNPLADFPLADYMIPVFWDYHANHIRPVIGGTEASAQVTQPGPQLRTVPPPISSPGPWVTTRSSRSRTGNQRRTFAQAASNATKPSAPINAHAAPRDLSRAELSALQRDQILNAYELRFKKRVDPQHRNASKEAFINAYISALAAEAALITAPTKPAQPAQTRPRARPVVTTEFTITRRPVAGTISKPNADPADIVRALQRSIRQAYNGTPPPVTLLSGRWSSNLSHNFVLTFSGTAANNDVLRLRKELLAPFGPGASIVPQRGYTSVMVKSVPTIRSEGYLPDAKSLLEELSQNVSCQGLTIVSPPRWIRPDVGEDKVHSSIIFAFIDETGTRLQQLTRAPLFLFGSRCKAELFNSLPTARECTRCHRLGHRVERCPRSKDAVICYICGGLHAPEQHAQKCPTIKNHKLITCDCPLQCINCRAMKLKAGGHLAKDLSCPLRKKYRRPDNRTGTSSSEEIDRDMIVDKPFPANAVPSSQPEADGVVGLRPASPARSNTSPPSTPTRDIPPLLRQYFADVTKWQQMDFSSLSLAELTSLPELAYVAAEQRGISISKLTKSLTNV